MDLDKVGKFIASSRKNKNLTQEELGRRLGVTGKTVSRWENGNYMPDISLLIPLSEELDISVNELLLGKKLNTKESDESLKYTINYSNKKIKNIKKKALYIFSFLIVLVLTFTGIFIVAYKDVEDEIKICKSKETFSWGSTLDDGRIVNYSINIFYKEKGEVKYLFDEIAYNGLTIEELVKNLEVEEVYRDGGSTLYKYDKHKKKYGDTDFYVMVCNVIDGDNNIYISGERKLVDGICASKINDLDGVKMVIKEGTLTNISATVLITDYSNRDNIYGKCYYIEKKENNKWVKLEIEHEVVCNLIGYKVNESHPLEFDINWEYLYGKLDSGTYRIVTSTSESGEAKDHLITAEFTLE